MKYVYCICYLDIKDFTFISKDLKRLGYHHIRSIVPTVKVEKQTSRNKKYYEEVPLLLNYGIIKMPLDKALSRPFLRKLSKEVRGIRGWLKSPEVLHHRKVKKRIDNIDIFDDFSIVARITREEVRRLLKLSRENFKYTNNDFKDLKVGSYVILKGYPYDGVDAQITKVDFDKEEVTLLIYPQYCKMLVTLPFDSVIYNVYTANSEEGKPLDYEVDFSNITESDITRVFEYRQS